MPYLQPAGVQGDSAELVLEVLGEIERAGQIVPECKCLSKHATNQIAANAPHAQRAVGGHSGDDGLADACIDAGDGAVVEELLL